MRVGHSHGGPIAAPKTMKEGPLAPLDVLEPPTCARTEPGVEQSDLVECRPADGQASPLYDAGLDDRAGREVDPMRAELDAIGRARA